MRYYLSCLSFVTNSLQDKYFIHTHFTKLRTEFKRWEVIWSCLATDRKLTFCQDPTGNFQVTWKSIKIDRFSPFKMVPIPLVKVSLHSRSTLKVSGVPKSICSIYLKSKWTEVARIACIYWCRISKNSYSLNKKIRFYYGFSETLTWPK